MSVPAALAVLALLVAASSLLAVLLAHRRGRGRTVNRPAPLPLPLTAEQLGSVATFVQFGTEICAPCRAASRRLEEFTAQHPGVLHLELDTADHPDLVRRLNILSAPTILLLDASGQIRVRFSGPPPTSEIARHVEAVAHSEGARVVH